MARKIPVAQPLQRVLEIEKSRTGGKSMRAGQGLNRGGLATGEPLKNFKQKRELIRFVKNYFGKREEG